MPHLQGQTLIRLVQLALALLVTTNFEVLASLQPSVMLLAEQATAVVKEDL